MSCLQGSSVGLAEVTFLSSFLATDCQHVTSTNSPLSTSSGSSLTTPSKTQGSTTPVATSEASSSGVNTIIQSKSGSGSFKFGIEMLWIEDLQFIMFIAVAAGMIGVFF